jgi:parallel beta-helix repeat protein
MMLTMAILLSGLLLVSNVHVNTVHAYTQKGGIINSDTTWTKSSSPYTFTGPVGIAEGVTLTIEPGVTINLGLFTLEVNGTLNAKGTPTDKVIFNSNHQNIWPPQNIILPYDNPTCKIENAILNQTSINGQSSYSNASVTINNCSLEGNAAINVWGSTTISNSFITGAVLLRGSSIVSDNTLLNGIDIAGSCSGSSFSGTYIVSGNNITNQQGIYVMNVGAAGTITGNIISGGSTAGICQADGFPMMSATIEKNLISNNQFGILIRTKNDNSTIQDNTITNNKIGILYPTPLQTITDNNIQDNSQYNIQAGYTTATAKNNWWGTTDSQAINQTIYDNKNDFHLGIVSFVPFLTAPNPQAMPNPNAPIPTPNTSPSSSSTPASNPSTSPTQNPTATPNQSGSQNAFLGLDWVQVATLVLLGVIAVLLVVVVLILHKRSVK